MVGEALALRLFLSEADLPQSKEFVFLPVRLSHVTSLPSSLLRIFRLLGSVDGRLD